jgi:hypothetical protein
MQVSDKSRAVVAGPVGPGCVEPIAQGSQQTT